MDRFDAAFPFGRRPSRGLLVLGDVLAAAAYTTVLTAQVLDRGPGAPDASGLPLWAEVLVAAGIGLSVAVRRYRPAVVFWPVLVLSLAAAFLGVLREPLLGAALALYTVSAAGDGRHQVPAWTIGALSAAAAITLALAGPRGFWTDGFDTMLVIGVVIMGFAWALGRGERERRLSAERFGRQLAEQAVTRERMRIAREMHDVVAHGMGLITVKAGVANHVARARPEEARDALRVIEATGREALNELRRMLDVLRSPVEGASAEPHLAPTPGIEDLPALAERAALAGVRVDLDVDVPSRLPDGVELAVYRIVQEALTNTAKHAAPARAAITVAADAGRVRVDVSDDGPGTRTLPTEPDHGPGHGLIGMAERVAAYHGTFQAGPRDGRGFRVSAVLPYTVPVRAEAG